jgi:2-C-methyl-D-erythritol 2,4-cyclodiphosphate synthase
MKAPICYRTGIGYDVHRLVENRKLILGGVEIPHEKGLDGHSDADVLVHAICDALLGAAGKGDIGQHFPNTDERYKGVSSLTLLKNVQQMVVNAGYDVGNVDAVVIADAPSLKAFKHQMRFNIAYRLGVQEDCVNIKATTNEGLGFLGAKEGIAAYATVLLCRKQNVGAGA